MILFKIIYNKKSPTGMVELFEDIIENLILNSLQRLLFQYLDHNMHLQP